MRASEFFKSNIFAGHGFNNVGSGNEHVGGLIHHHNKVSDRRGIHGASGARTHDQGNLGDHPRGHYVSRENFTVKSKCHNAFLDACTTRVIQTDHGTSGFERKIHYFDDFFAEYFT